jgi:hypothetical protein
VVTEPDRSNTGTVVVVVVGGRVVVVVGGGNVVVVVVVARIAGVAGSWATPLVQAAATSVRAARVMASLDMVGDGTRARFLKGSSGAFNSPSG